MFTLDKYFPEDSADLRELDWAAIREIMLPMTFKVNLGSSSTGHDYRKGATITIGENTRFQERYGYAKAEAMYQDGSSGGVIYFHDLIPESLNRRFIALTLPFIQRKMKHLADKLDFLEHIESKCPEDPMQPVDLEDIRIEKVLKKISSKEGMTTTDKIKLIKSLFHSNTNEELGKPEQEELVEDRIYYRSPIEVARPKTDELSTAERVLQEISDGDNGEEDRD